MSSTNNDYPEFLLGGNRYYVIIGWSLIMVANITVFVFGTAFNLIGIVTWPLGMIFLYLNYRAIKHTNRFNKISA